MRFALLGDHPDGLAMARALVTSGRHSLAAYVGPPTGLEALRRWDIAAQLIGDVEEVLADPAVEAVIVAGPPADRPALLRRVLQSERHALCVYPVDQTPDAAYEAAMIQGDTGCALLPLLPDALHPGVRRLAAWARAADGPTGALQLVRLERSAPGDVLLDTGSAGARPAFPGWDVLRTLGGEVAEVSALTPGEAVAPDALVLLTGRFERSGLFEAVFLPGQSEASECVILVGGRGRAELVFPAGRPGPAQLTWQDGLGAPCREAWETWDPWPALVEVFEETLEQPRRGANGQAVGTTGLSWQAAVRGLELNDAARRSAERR
jgi:predicted dehydrogenase